MRQKKTVIVDNPVGKQEKSAQTHVKKRKRTPGHSITEDCELLDGAAKVYRTTKSGSFWSMSCWLKTEKKCYRRALKTKNKEEAINLARNEYFKLQGDLRAGNRIFSKTAQELVNAFVSHKKDEANTAMITQERVTTIKISLNKWFLTFVGKNTKLDKISRRDFEGYYVWRRKQSPDVRNATLVNERALISSLYKYGISHGFLRHDQTPIFPRMHLKKTEMERRDNFDFKEWQTFYRHFPGWITRAENEEERNQRKFVRDFIILSANTGLRFGEMRKLKWGMIRTYKVAKEADKRTQVQISVPHDTKTGARTVIGLRGDIFERIKSYSKFTKANDWVFANNKTGEQIHKKVYYKFWEMLLKETKLNTLGKKLTYYSLRHTYITFRLMAGVNTFALAQNAGTSIQMIEAHYAHVKSEVMKTELTKAMRMDEAGQILLSS